jgi:phosphate transport system permease protein
LKPKKFNRARLTDRLMRILITVFGFSAVAAVLSMVGFLFVTVRPLFSPASIAPQWSEFASLPSQAEPPSDYILGMGETMGQIQVIDSEAEASQPLAKADPGFADLGKSTGRRQLTRPGEFKALAWDVTGQTRLVIGEQTVSAQIPEFAGAASSGVIWDTAISRQQTFVAFASQGDRAFHLVSVKRDGSTEVQTYSAESSDAEFDGIVALHLAPNGNSLVVVDSTGRLLDFAVKSGRPLQWLTTLQLDSPTVVAFLNGSDALAVGNSAGRIDIVSRIRRTENGRPEMQVIRSFAVSKHAIQALAVSHRSKTVIAEDAEGRFYGMGATTGRILFEAAGEGTAAGEKIHSIFLSSRDDALVGLSADRVYVREIHMPHADFSLAALFEPIRYEGFSQPEYIWQTTGGTDQFEPKYSLLPLIAGTLKAALYALTFAIPLAVLAAMYSNLFAPAWFKNASKPVVEFAAALPSVVVGFWAAYVLAPWLNDRLSLVIALPVVVLLVFIVSLAAISMAAERFHLPKTVLPIALAVLCISLTALLAPLAGAGLERWVFGGNPQDWLLANLGQVYDSRNALVVGIALGFAVVPVVYSIAEDAFETVPRPLIAGALALGATKWQAVRKIALRVALPGVCAAAILGLGRAVGETMIVLMATGNTPIMDFLPFSGMRAMSATIAVEMPEAPVGSTHYRVLFLVGLLLFMFTFVLNSVATFINHRLKLKVGDFS